jgi:hypothetical protein
MINLRVGARQKYSFGKPEISNRMSEVRLFVGFYTNAIRSLFANPQALLFAVFCTLFGTTIPGFLQTGGPLESFAPVVSAFFERHPYILFATSVPISLFVLSSAALTLSLHKKRTSPLSILRDSVRIFPRLLGLKASFWLFLLVVTTFLSLPGLIAASTDMVLSRTLLALGFVILLPIITIAAFAQSYASLHIVLSKTSFSASLHLGYDLFRRRPSTSIVFTAVSFLMVIIVSAFSQLAIFVAALVSSVALRPEYLISAILFVIQVLFSVVRTAAWLSLFALINTGPDEAHTEEASQKSEKMIQKEVSEIG